MQETTNLKLKKPDLTDYVNVADLNENSDKIDAAVGALKDGTASIPALETTNKTLAGGINENKKNLTTHLADDAKHGIFTMDGKRYQGEWALTNDLTGLRFIYNEVTS